MKQTVTEAAGDWTALLLAGLGVTFSGVDYIGGLFFALSAAMITRHWFPEKDRREIWLTLLSAWFISTVGVILFHSMFPESNIPHQFVMIALGLSSRWIGKLVMNVLFRLEQRTPEIADRVVDSGLDRTLGPDKGRGDPHA